jgi:hypothetical protein
MNLFEIKAREPLFFMHIPKTAGMSMRLYLREQYDVRDVCPALRWHGLLGREHELASFRLVLGHFRYNLRQLLAANARMLVMLRDPLRRTVSALQHLQRDPDFNLSHTLAKGLSLSQMIRHPVLMGSQSNVQARFLCASRSPGDVSAYLKQELQQNPKADAGDREAPPRLQLAQDRLEQIEFVGLTENIGAIVSAMAQAMNFHPPLYFPFINENPNRADPLQDLSDEDLAILRAHNEIDLEIYNYAKRLIERRAFGRDMRQLVHGGVYATPPGSFEIPVGGIIPGSGWYTPEQNNGRSWRWTGPGRHFTLEVPLRGDTSYRLILRFGGAAPPDPDDIWVEVNDRPVAFEPPQEAQPYQRELIIPQALLAPDFGFCRIRFETPQPVRLSPSDVRALGVCIGRIEFECLDS